MTNLWVEASRDLESEQNDRLSVTASVAAAQFWPFLAASATEREFEHRLGYIEDDLHQAMSDVPEAVRVQATAKLREDYRLLASSRKTASVSTLAQLHDQLRDEGYRVSTSGGLLEVRLAERLVLVKQHSGNDFAVWVDPGDGGASSGDVKWYTGDTVAEGVAMQFQGTALDDLHSVSSRKTASSRVTTLREIVDRHQHQEIDGMIVDVQTANLLLQVYYALSDKNKARFDDLPLERLVDLGWRNVASRKEAAAPALPLLRGFGHDGKHYSRHGYLETGSPVEYWVNDGDGYRQIAEDEYEAALSAARANPRNDVYRLPGSTSSRAASKR